MPIRIRRNFMLMPIRIRISNNQVDQVLHMSKIPNFFFFWSQHWRLTMFYLSHQCQIFPDFHFSILWTEYWNFKFSGKKCSLSTFLFAWNGTDTDPDPAKRCGSESGSTTINTADCILGLHVDMQKDAFRHTHNSKFNMATWVYLDDFDRRDGASYHKHDWKLFMATWIFATNLTRSFKAIPGGILQTVAGCQPYCWLQLGDCTNRAESERHSANTSPPAKRRVKIRAESERHSANTSPPAKRRH